jgi:hypothetical protein
MTQSLRAAAALLVSAASLGAAACGSSPSSPTVPSAPGAAATGSSGHSSRATIDAAVHCIRDHGIPGYQDPAITPDGTVYTDMRSFQDAPESAQQSVRRSCRALMASAHLDPVRQPPAPAALVRAGVKAARCARAHGLPAKRDPNASTPYTPGHGFGLSPGEVPEGGKSSPGFQTMRQACKVELDAMMKASSLASLGGHGS